MKKINGKQIDPGTVDDNAIGTREVDEQVGGDNSLLSGSAKKIGEWITGIWANLKAIFIRLTHIDDMIASLKGIGGYLTPYDFGKAIPTQQELTDYALSQIPNIDDPLDIFNGTHVKNKFDSNVWVLNNTQNTDPTVFEWINDGKLDIKDASNTESGLFKGVVDPGNSSKNGFVTITDGKEPLVIGYASDWENFTAKHSFAVNPASRDQMCVTIGHHGLVDGRAVGNLLPGDYRYIRASNNVKRTYGHEILELKMMDAIDITSESVVRHGILRTIVPWPDTSGGYVKQIFTVNETNNSSTIYAVDKQYQYERCSQGADNSETWGPWVETSNWWKPVTFTRDTTHVSNYGDSVKFTYNPSIKTLNMRFNCLDVLSRTSADRSTCYILLGNITMPFTSSILTSSPDKILVYIEARKSEFLLEQQTLPICLYPTGEVKLYLPASVFSDNTSILEIYGVGSFVLY
jgi:hypothetical protein